MRKKRKTVWAFLDGKKLVDVVQAALDNNMMVDDLKAKLIAENPGHEVTFTGRISNSSKPLEGGVHPSCPSCTWQGGGRPNQSGCEWECPFHSCVPRTLAPLLHNAWKPPPRLPKAINPSGPCRCAYHEPPRYQTGCVLHYL